MSTASDEARGRFRGKLRRRVAQIAIVVAIIVVASFTVVGLTPGGNLSLNGGAAVQETTPPNLTDNRTGQLAIIVNLASNLGPSNLTGTTSLLYPSQNVSFPNSFTCNTGNGTCSIAISSVPSRLLPSTVVFTAVARGLLLPLQHRLDVPQPGSLTTELPEGNYSLTTVNPYYNLSLFVQIVPNHVTRLDVHLEAAYYEPRVVSLFDPDLSGAIGTWGRIDLLMQPKITLAPGDLVQIQRSYYSSGLAAGQLVWSQANQSLPVNCVNGLCVLQPVPPLPTAARVLSVSPSGAGVWVSLSPLSTFETRGLAALWFVELSSSYVVTPGGP